MDKRFILQYVRTDHFQDNEGIMELIEVFGLDTVKQLFDECEGLRFEVPILNYNKQLIKDIIIDNPDLSLRDLVRKTGVPMSRLYRYVREIKRRQND